MKLLKGFQADRLISQIGTLDRSSPDAKKVAEKLSQLGPAAIPPLLEALELADRNQTPIYVDLLGKLLDARTLPYFTEALSSTISLPFSCGWSCSAFAAKALKTSLTEPVSGAVSAIFSL